MGKEDKGCGGAEDALGQWNRALMKELVEMVMRKVLPLGPTWKQGEKP